MNMDLNPSNYTIDELKDLYSLDKSNVSMAQLNNKYSTMIQHYTKGTGYYDFLVKTYDILKDHIMRSDESSGDNDSIEGLIRNLDIGDEYTMNDLMEVNAAISEKIRELIIPETERSIYKSMLMNRIRQLEKKINERLILKSGSAFGVGVEPERPRIKSGFDPVLKGYSLPVAQDENLNPTLRNLNRRIVNIDTQMRQSLRNEPNGVTLDLSEPLVDVLKIKVVSVEIRHSWYAFSQKYGNVSFTVDGSNIEITDGNYTSLELVDAVNQALDDAGITDLDASYNEITCKVELINSGGSSYTVSFYDNSAPGKSKKNNNLGWLLGFRMFDADYNLEYTIAGGSSIIADAMVDTFGPKYILLALDDFNNNHVNRNYVSIDDTVETAKYPSYYTPDISLSDPAYKASYDSTGACVWVPSGLTHAQACTIKGIYESRIGNSDSANRNIGLKTNDVLAKIPVNYTDKCSQLIVSYNYINNNERVYYGPVNIKRVNIALYNDVGQLLDLNRQDFSVTLQVEELYQY